MHIQIHSRTSLAAAVAAGLPPHALISFRDPEMPPVPPTPGCQGRLDCYCRDVGADCTDLAPPDRVHAQHIARFVQAVEAGEGGPPADNLVLQCEKGIGRSAAVAIALAMRAGEPKAVLPIRRQGTHNRLLLELMLQQFCLPPIVEPPVVMVVRVKYPLNRLALFANCMDRQRYDNWRVLFVSDGPFDDYEMPWTGDPIGYRLDARLNLLETPERRGLWGHPWRQAGIDAALAMDPRPAYIGLSNDDNYYVPGYLEQMVLALQEENAQLVLCDMLHSYTGWEACDALKWADVGSWLASADLVASTPWPGAHCGADGEYVTAMGRKASRVAVVRKPLFVHN